MTGTHGGTWAGRESQAMSSFSPSPRRSRLGTVEKDGERRKSVQGDTAPPGPGLRGRRVYRHRFRWLFLISGPLLAFGAVVGLVSGLAEGDVSRLVVGLLQLPGAVGMFLLARALRVETSPEGLAYHNMGFYTVRAGWEDVERVARVPFRGMGRVECILLRRSTVRGWTGLAWAVPNGERGLTIPLGSGWSSWSDADELKRDVLRYAPHAVG